jgi:hypothetical protein
LYFDVAVIRHFLKAHKKLRQLNVELLGGVTSLIIFPT